MGYRAFPARDGCLEVGERCLRFLQLLSAEQFRHRQPPNDSIGSHLRHCLDFQNCFLKGVETSEIYYDRRERDPTLSEDPEKFRKAFSASLEAIRKLDPALASKQVTLGLIANSSGESLSCHSSIERELAFLTGHTVHHLAIVQLLAEMQGVHVSSELTTAFSTEVHRQEMAARRPESVDV